MARKLKTYQTSLGFRSGERNSQCRIAGVLGARW